MLYRRGNQWEVYPHRVRYTQHGNEIEQWALPNKEWWIDFAEKWEHTEIIEFIDIELTEEHRARFEEIKNMPEDFIDVYIDYILNATFPIEFPNTHQFMTIKLLKENERLERENKTQDTVIEELMFVILPEITGGGI